MKKLIATILFLFTTVSLKAADVRHVNNDGDGFCVSGDALKGKIDER